MSKDLEKEYLEDLDHYDEGMGIHSTSYGKCRERLIRLAEIDNADPSEALEKLEFICKILKEKSIDIKWLFKHDYNIIKQALIKAQDGIKRLETIDNSNPSEALNITKATEKYTGIDLSVIKDALIKAQEQEKENAKYKQLEEQLGCPLEVLFKALDEGFICEMFVVKHDDYKDYPEKWEQWKKESNNEKQWITNIKYLNFNLWYKIIYFSKGDTYMEVWLEDYKKTWWLKEDKSE